MSKYLELVGGSFNESHFDKQKNQNPYVAYSIKDDNFIYAIISKEEEKVDPTAGFVDLGLSVMWASCDVGASSPEGEGTKYAWGLESWDDIPLDSDPVYVNSSMESKMLQPRTPSPMQIQELLDNTTATEEVLNGVLGVRYTASNGNSIFVSNAERWTNAEKWKVNGWNTAVAVYWSPSEGLVDNGDISQAYKSDLLLFRGICSYLPQGNAQGLKYGTEIVLEDTLYCFPKSWQATQFIANAKSSIKMYAATTPEFTATDESTNLLAIHTFSIDEYGSELSLSLTEMLNLTRNAKDDYIYVRFQSESPTTITVQEWHTSASADSSIRITSARFSIPAKSSNTIYRLKYADWVGYDMSIKWTGSSDLQVYIADTGSFFLSSTAAEVVLYTKISRRTTKTLTAETVNSWASRVDADGFLYVRFNSNNQGYVTFTSAKPADV